ncbi:hypothetical protein LJC61_03060 [Ruminococcaceae bacterium OttesenSCG-928-A16]|nr:hypothetical protein [Ruminococcaceae bacterium OttesenSCG-928-A16]
MLALKYIARKLKISSLNLFFRKIHIPLGVALLAIGTAHGVISFAQVTGRTAAIITGILTIILIFFIAATYLFKKRLKKRWMHLHRIGTVALLPCIFLHLLLALI